MLLLPDAPDVGEHADDGGRGGERPNAGGAARQHHIVASASLVSNFCLSHSTSDSRTREEEGGRRQGKELVPNSLTSEAKGRRHGCVAGQHRTVAVTALSNFCLSHSTSAELERRVGFGGASR